MAAKPNDEKKSHMVTIRMDRLMKAAMDDAAEATGRSLSGEIQSRLADYESMRRLVDDLLGDSAEVKVGMALATVRRTARAQVWSSDPTDASLQQAMIAATCIAELFRTVASHAATAYAERTKSRLKEGWQRRIDAGGMKGDFDQDAMASQISTDLMSRADSKGHEFGKSHFGDYWTDRVGHLPRQK